MHSCPQFPLLFVALFSFYLFKGQADLSYNAQEDELHQFPKVFVIISILKSLGMILAKKFKLIPTFISKGMSVDEDIMISLGMTVGIRIPITTELPNMFFNCQWTLEVSKVAIKISQMFFIFIKIV